MRHIPLIPLVTLGIAVGIVELLNLQHYKAQSGTVEFDLSNSKYYSKNLSNEVHFVAEKFKLNDSGTTAANVSGNVVADKKNFRFFANSVVHKTNADYIELSGEVKISYDDVSLQSNLVTITHEGELYGGSVIVENPDGKAQASSFSLVDEKYLNLEGDVKATFQQQD